MAPTRIHHVNFVVRDLEEAAARFEHVLGLEPFEIVDHAPRGAKIARSRVGESWIVLVCPCDEDSVPGRYLAKNGEGFFLLSLGVEDLTEQLDALQRAGKTVKDPSPRSGILDWQVADIGDLHGAQFQLTGDDRGSRKNLQEY